jgi:hypothetical protein
VWRVDVTIRQFPYAPLLDERCGRRSWMVRHLLNSGFTIPDMSANASRSPRKPLSPRPDQLRSQTTTGITCQAPMSAFSIVQARSLHAPIADSSYAIAPLHRIKPCRGQRRHSESPSLQDALAPIVPFSVELHFVRCFNRRFETDSQSFYRKHPWKCRS